jgi:adenine-specific DNA-methyltransferase
MTENYKKLIRTLRRLFEMDRADLDFGFYRIMHTKAEQVQEFIEKDLLQTVKMAFGEQSGQNSRKLLEKASQKVIQTLGEDALDADGNLNSVFSASPAGKQYQDEVAQILRQKDDASAETDIYDHLCRFFERYYEGGDFISRRYYARETSGKAAPYAIPYNGEEVKLHWANADQYYIKTTENYNNFTFDLRQAREVQAALESIPLLAAQDETDKTPLRVHFRIKDASEGEHGNVKATDATKRFFVLHSEQPVEKNEAGELVVNFEYKPLASGKYAVNAEREKQLKALYKSSNKGDLPALDIADIIITTVESLEGMAEYHQLLQILSPTEKIKKRPLLVRYLNKYTASNTMDYFIHKDLSGFLRRELDFYIKNEVMHLDDIENADAPAVESYLAKIKVLRKIAGKLIDFLTQLENFQKKLWLKKKFVVECNYCLTLDRVPEELYGEIVDCDAQWEEWVGLGFLTTDDTDTRVRRKEILEKEPYLVLDTKFYGEEFKERLLATLDNLDEQCDGLLIHSENFQALNLLQKRYREQVKCVYIDPPYNTGKDGFPYKDNYQHSTWITMIHERLEKSMPFVKRDGAFFISIDEKEHHNLKYVSDELFGLANQLADFVWLAEGNFDNQAKVKMAHEYILSYAINNNMFEPPPVIDPSITDESKLFRDEIRNTLVKNGPKNPISKIVIPKGFPASFENGVIERRKVTWPKYNNDIVVKKFKIQHPILAESGWSSKSLCEDFINNNMRYVTDSKGQKTKFELTNTGAIESVKKRDKKQSYVISTIKGVGTIQSTKSMLTNMDCPYPYYPKPPQLISYVISMATVEGQYILDYFAGSGSTAHAVINLNREDGGKRKYILVEMGDYFQTVLKPRIPKIIYSAKWKNKKPTAPDTGISHTFKYLRLESYEDTLNNLRFDDNKMRDKVLAANPSLQEDYTLNYFLDVETRGSQSLLNIDRFADPRRYTLKVKKPGSEEYTTQNVDLIETFNYLIGLRVTHLATSQTFKATFKRNPDPELPEEQHTKLVVDGTIHITKECTEYTEKGPKNLPCPSGSSVVDNLEPVLCTAEPSAVQKNQWWFRKIEGWLPSDPANPNNGQTQKILIVWRNLSGDLEKDNVVLDEWFQNNRISTRDFEFDTIYVNGSNNLPNLREEEDTWKVRLIEEEFMKKMWDVETV